MSDQDICHAARTLAHSIQGLPSEVFEHLSESIRKETQRRAFEAAEKAQTEGNNDEEIRQTFAWVKTLGDDICDSALRFAAGREGLHDSFSNPVLIGCRIWRHG